MYGSYENIAVHPYYRLFDPSIADLSGGPNWPDFHERTFERHQRFGRPIDSEFEPISNVNSHLRLRGKFIWVGPVIGHFGHQLLDFSTRVAATARLNVGTKYLVSTQISRFHPESKHPKSNWHYPTVSDIPLYVRNILKWVGIPEENLTIVNEPVSVDELVVFEQGEQFMVPPADWYLDALDEIVAQKECIRAKKIYVSRTRLKSRLGNILGERALEVAFARSGFTIVYPETLPVSVQARIYMGAELIVFAEGSAIHGLSLLGHMTATVIVLERRDNTFSSEVFARSVSPRVTSYVAIQSVETSFPSSDHWRSISILNLETIIEKLFAQGIDFKGSLIQSEYWDSVAEDLQQIAATELSSPAQIENLFPNIGSGISEDFSEFSSNIRQRIQKEK
jgi:hypothetical protein